MSDVRTRYLDDEDAQRLYETYTELRASPDDYCPTCTKTGSYLWQGKRVICDCEGQLQLYKHYLHSGIGSTYQRLGWSDFEGSDEIVKSIAKYIAAHSRYITRGIGLLLSGPHGSGKTMIANLALKEFVKLGYRCYATTFSQVKEDFVKGWDYVEEKSVFSRRYYGAELLLLDDMGREYTNELVRTTFETVLRERVQRGRPTFITTNLSLEEIGDGYGQAVLSLLHEKFRMMTFSGEDYRPRIRSREEDEDARGETRPIV